MALALIAALILTGCGDHAGEASPPVGHLAAVHRGFEAWAVGDAADGSTSARGVAETVRSASPDLLLYLGDVYASSDVDAFRTLYDPLYGALANRTVPTPGNHEWPQARSGYFAYWRQKLGHRLPSYFARRAGGWKVLSLNSNLRGRAFRRQLSWTRRALRGPGTCRIAIWHAPRFSAGLHGDAPELEPLWRAVVGRARLVLNGHDHTLQRLHPIGGTTILVSGAGGRTLYPVDGDDPRLAFSDHRHFGALRLRLAPGHAAFAFVGAGGRTLDSGRVRCRRAAAG
jgi:hypothetical protein